MRDLVAQHHEARPGDARRGREINAAQALAHLDVIARLEGEAARLAPVAHLKIGTLVGTLRHRGMQQIGKPELPLLQLLLYGAELRLRLGERDGEALALGDECAGLLAAPLGHADRLGVGVALSAQAVQFHRPGLALFLQRPQGRHIELEAAARQIARYAFRVGAQQLRIDHCQPFDSLRERRRASASPILISSPRGTGR